MKTITTTAKTQEMKDTLANLITVELEGTEKQISYARSILVSAISDATNRVLASYGRGKEVTVSIDDKIVTALNMHNNAGFIISNKSSYQWGIEKKIYSLISVN